ncbi:MAG: hypothetical protein M3169_14020 [Candidatus Eremiobacteraeota bacterium]|nr:hypothetical protein [Candidatus Eremiobacteraeota bacterium]
MRRSSRRSKRRSLPRITGEARGTSYFITDSCANDAALRTWSDVFARETFPSAMHRLLLQRAVLRLEPAPRSLYGNEACAPSALAT